MLAHHIKAHGHARTHTAAFHLELGVMRRDLHDSPEIGFEERHTAQRVVESLWVCDVDEIQTGFGRTGAVALIHEKGRGRGQMMRLRADADAPIITEQNEVAWKSTWPGLMADRKHDGHPKMLVNAARCMAETRQLDGTAARISRLGEKESATNDTGHRWREPAGRDGGGRSNHDQDQQQRRPWRASLFHGRSGAVVADRISTAGQSTVSRSVRAVDSVVISRCAMQAGGNRCAFCVVPSRATQVRALVEKRLCGVCSAFALGPGASAQVNHERRYPANINTGAGGRFVASVVQKRVGHSQMNRHMGPSMDGENFLSCCKPCPAPMCGCQMSTT
jgi:metal-dependent amidase/aminoacylase/carboxypeptidase family protein